MLTPATTERSSRTIRIPLPWTNTVGLARTLLALGTALTLIASRPESVFSYRLDTGPTPVCTDARVVLAFCLGRESAIAVPYIVSIAVLLVAASGWRPRITAIPQWYIHLSLYTGMSAPDGGDQLATILALILVPIALTDNRRWHWSTNDSSASAMSPSRILQWRVAAAAAFLIVAKVQVSVVYFQAGVAKLSHAEWADGTSFYYWSSDPMFGVAPWAADSVRWMTENPNLVVWFAWIPILLEVCLAAGCLIAIRYRKYLLVAAVLFHAGIALLMGLWSFAFTMWAADLLLLGPLGYQLSRWIDYRKHGGQDTSSGISPSTRPNSPPTLAQSTSE